MILTGVDLWLGHQSKKKKKKYSFFPQKHLMSDTKASLGIFQQGLHLDKGEGTRCTVGLQEQLILALSSFQKLFGSFVQTAHSIFLLHSSYFCCLLPSLRRQTCAGISIIGEGTETQEGPIACLRTYSMVGANPHSHSCLPVPRAEVFGLLSKLPPIRLSWKYRPCLARRFFFFFLSPLGKQDSEDKAKNAFWCVSHSYSEAKGFFRVDPVALSLEQRGLCCSLQSPSSWVVFPCHPF